MRIFRKPLRAVSQIFSQIFARTNDREIFSISYRDSPTDIQFPRLILKKNTAFIKRLKTGLHTYENVLVLIKETGTLSLDKYLSEISIASNEGLTKCKSAAEIWVPSSFTEPFIQQFLSGLALPNKQYLAGLAPDQREREENSRIIRQRRWGDYFWVLKDLLTANREALFIPLPLAVSFSKQFGSLYLPTTAAGPTPSEAANQPNLAETLSLSPPTLPGPDTASSSNAITGTGLSSNFELGRLMEIQERNESKADQADGENEQPDAQAKLEEEMEKLEMKDLILEYLADRTRQTFFGHDKLTLIQSETGLTALFTRLDQVYNPDALDKITVDLRISTQRLPHLSSVNKNRTDLIRYYARMLATLSKFMPDVLTGILANVHEEFRYLQRKRKFVAQELHAIRSKNVRWISELTKFNLVPSHLILHIIKVCLDDLHGTNVENLCDLLEGCGRWLDQNAEEKGITELRFPTDNLLENAYFQHRTPMELYIRYQLYDCLSKKSVDRTIKTLRKLHWNDPEVVKLLKNILTKVWKVKFGNIYLLAIIVTIYLGFMQTLPSQSSISSNIINKRIATIKYLGELYNYRVIDSRVIFDTLWSFVTFGHLRMVCTLLNTCGHCFDRGSLKRRLNNFLKFFIMYLRCKEPPPMDVDFLLQDTFEELRPKLNIYSTYEEASKAVQEMFSSIPDRGEKADEDGLQEDEEGRDGEDKRSEPEDNEEGGSESDNDTVMADEGDRAEAEFEEEDLPRFPTSGATAEEEEEFEKELAKMIAETTTSSNANTTTESSATTGLEKLNEIPWLEISFLIKLKTMQIPSNSSIAVHTRAQQMHSQVEHQQLKKLVLDYEMREEANERKSIAAEMTRKGINVKFLNE
ncbi:hypothetical protein H4Q26_000717 [Puccinia striiformis f. sp. tritici PST-130]|nr:hypothetical protein H4Q26_000717 [Puccinia striiformis f. sp. tritici PST-130]